MYKIFLICIIILAASLRFYQLGSLPPSMTWDEAAWAYNAYSLSIDGKDEFGKFLPIQYLESFGDFKPPVYAYLAILPIKLFGLNEFGVRFPSAFFGVLTVFLTYFLVKRLFYQSKQKEILALFTTVMLAVSPWHIMLSRAAFEANVSTFFIIAGVWAFLGGVQEKKWYLVLSALFFSVSMYTFNTARIVSPLLVILLAFVFRTQLLQRKKEMILALILGAVLVMPTIPFLLSPQASLRYKEVNIFAGDTADKIIKRTNQEIINDNNSTFSKIIHNRRAQFAVEYLKHYFDNLSPSFLFLVGDGNHKFSTHDVGQLYLVDLPFLLFGLYLLFKKREGYWWLIILWLLVGIIPAGVARETPHALRIETTLPTFHIIIAYGLVNSLNFLYALRLQRFLKKTVIICFILLYLLNIFNYLLGYYIHYSREYSEDWQYGYKTSVSFLSGQKENYDNIFITTSLGRPYIYYLVYDKVDPVIFRKTQKVERSAFGFVNVYAFDTYRFIDEHESIYSLKGRNLYVKTGDSVPEGAKIVKEFRNLNGKVALVAFTWE